MNQQVLEIFIVVQFHQYWFSKFASQTATGYFAFFGPGCRAREGARGPRPTIVPEPRQSSRGATANRSVLVSGLPTAAPPSQLHHFRPARQSNCGRRNRRLAGLQRCAGERACGASPWPACSWRRGAEAARHVPAEPAAPSRGGSGHSSLRLISKDMVFTPLGQRT